MNNQVITGCRLLTKGMLSSLARTGELYVGFPSSLDLATLYQEINDLYRKEACLLKIPIKKVIVDNNILRYQ